MVVDSIAMLLFMKWNKFTIPNPIRAKVFIVNSSDSSSLNQLQNLPNSLSIDNIQSIFFIILIKIRISSISDTFLSNYAFPGNQTHDLGIANILLVELQEHNWHYL